MGQAIPSGLPRVDLRTVHLPNQLATRMVAGAVGNPTISRPQLSGQIENSLPPRVRTPFPGDRNQRRRRRSASVWTGLQTRQRGLPHRSANRRKPRQYPAARRRSALIARLPKIASLIRRSGCQTPTHDTLARHLRQSPSRSVGSSRQDRRRNPHSTETRWVCRSEPDAAQLGNKPPASQSVGRASRARQTRQHIWLIPNGKRPEALIQRTWRALQRRMKSFVTDRRG